MTYQTTREFEADYECDEATYTLNIFYAWNIFRNTFEVEKVMLISSVVWMFDRKNGIPSKPEEPKEIPYRDFQWWVNEKIRDDIKKRQEEAEDRKNDFLFERTRNND